MRSFRKVAGQAGLEIELQRYFFQWLFPLKLAIRLAERLFPLQPKPPGIPAGWFNATLYGLSRFEYKALRPLPVPFGSSLMVVGRKQNT
jgi:hypothetical protein